MMKALDINKSLKYTLWYKKRQKPVSTFQSLSEKSHLHIAEMKSTGQADFELAVSDGLKKIADSGIVIEESIAKSHISFSIYVMLPTTVHFSILPYIALGDIDDQPLKAGCSEMVQSFAVPVSQGANDPSLKFFY